MANTFYHTNNLQLLWLTLSSPHLKFNVKVLYVFNQNRTEHTLFLRSHTNIKRNWDYAVSGARLMSHGGHFLLSPSHVIFFVPDAVFISSLPSDRLPPSPTSSSFRFYSSTFFHPFPYHNRLPLSVSHTHLSPSVSYYTHSSVICSMWNLPRTDISSWAAVSEEKCFL